MPAAIKFSVVIPTYNRSKVCLRAVQSIFAQTHEHLECIVVDDCSTDDTLAALATIKDSRLKLFKLPKNSGGSSEPINFGVSKAENEWIAFLDSDDFWKPRRLEAAAEQIALASSTEGLFYGSSIILYPHGIPRIVPAYIDGNIFPDIQFNNIIGIASRVIVRKEVFIKAGGFDESRYMDNDWECWIRVCQLTKVKSLLTPYVLYTENADSISSNADKVINGRNAFLVYQHGEAYCNVHRDAFKRQLSKLLLSRGNRKMARQLILQQQHRSLAFYLFLGSTYLPVSLLLNSYAILSYVKFFLISIKKMLADK
jgi:glycosyltransferase involved in cell wall biosynthesis